MLALYATGRFASLQVEADTGQQQRAHLVFVVNENYFLRRHQCRLARPRERTPGRIS